MRVDDENRIGIEDDPLLVAPRTHPSYSLESGAVDEADVCGRDAPAAVRGDRATGRSGALQSGVVSDTRSSPVGRGAPGADTSLPFDRLQIEGSEHVPPRDELEVPVGFEASGARWLG